MPFLKNIRCRNCGAPKVTRPRTAYVYCDYCAVYTDYDFQIAIANPAVHPGSQYQALQVSLHPRMEEARLNNDRQRYMECQRELFTLHIETCPASYSPRIGDQAYRALLLDYLATTQMISLFNDDAKAIAAEMDKATSVLRWVGAKVRSDTFWRLFDAYRKQSEVVLAECESLGAFQNHPDEITPKMAGPVGYSVFAQGWLSHLAEEDADRLLEVTGLGGQYTNLPEPETVKRHCGNCGQDLETVKGARCVLCESCGFRVDAEALELPCQECGAKISVIAGAKVHTCPYCSSEIRIV